MKKNRFYLSERDQGVPEKYIPLTDFLSNPQYALPGYSKEEWAIGYKSLDAMRNKTFSQAKKRFELVSSNNFASFWNGNLDAINEAGINEFTKLPSMRVLGGVMIAFETKSDNPRRKNSRYISFGISKFNYEKYVKKIKDSISEGRVVESVVLRDSHKQRSSDMFNFSLVKIEIDNPSRNTKQIVSIHKTDLYLEFEKWCKIKGKTKKQGIYEALQYLLAQNPIEPKEMEKLISKKNIFGGYEVIIDTKNEEKTTCSVSMPTFLYDTIKAIIRRFNSDPENISKKNLTVSTLVAQALSHYIKYIPLKYVDPIAYKEYIKIKAVEEYNEKMKK